MKDCSELLHRWIEMVNRISDEISDLLWQREQIRMIGKMIDDNPQLLESGKPFLWEARRWYMVFAAMAVRRQSDRGDKLVSLSQLLTEMLERPDCITRDLLVEQVRRAYPNNRDTEFEQLLVDGNWEPWRNDAGTLNIDRILRERGELDATSSQLIAFAGSTIAHTSRAAIGKDFNLTFNDLDKAIDLLEKLTISYESLLTSKGSISLVPVVQYDWYQQFRFPWRPQK